MIRFIQKILVKIFHRAKKIEEESEKREKRAEDMLYLDYGSPLVGDYLSLGNEKDD